MPKKLNQAQIEGEAVKRLQYDLITLGYLEMEDVGANFGSFGRQTQSAVEKFQKDLGLQATGKYGEIEQKFIADIQAGIARSNPNAKVVKAIQNRLIKNGYLTQTQVNSGYGNFGLQTEAAVKRFQKDNKLTESGIVGAKTYEILFNQTTVEKPAEIIAKDGKFYTVAANILITERLKTKIENLAAEYYKITGDKLIITSGYRSPARQALAMYNKIVFEGEAKIRALYANKAAVDEILKAFRAAGGNPQTGVEAMTKVIENQIGRKPAVFISNHLLDNAIDVRKMTTNLDSLQKALKKSGGKVIVESDHYHIELH